MKNKHLCKCIYILLVVCVAFAIFANLRTETTKTPNRSTQIPHKVYRIGDEVCKSPIDVQEALLAVSDIEEVYLLPMMGGAEPCRLTEEEVQELSSLLVEIELKKNGSKEHLEWTGVYFKMFLIVYNNGTQIEFSGCYPFYIIDSVGYKGERRLCHAITHLYESFHKEYYPYFCFF